MSKLQAVIQQDLSKGSNVVTSPYVIGKQQGILFINFLLDEHGSLTARDGTLIQTSSPDAAPSIRPIVKLFDYIKQNGTIIKLAMVLGSGGGNQLYNRGTTPWTLIGTFSVAENLPDILTFTDVAIIANGYETPRFYDGATLQLITGGVGTVPGGAKHHTLHQGFYWVWNTAVSSGALDGPSSLRSSDLNNGSSWPNANQVFIDKDDGDSGQGLGQFTIAETGISPSTSQILFKGFSGYQMTGVFGSTSPVFAIQRIKSDMGCVAPRSIRFAPGFGLIRLAHRGFALFDGVDDRLISEEIRPLIMGTHGFAGIDWTNAKLSYAVVVPNPPMYICACPTGGPGLTRWFCYDLVRRAWTILQFANTVSTLQAIQDPGVLPVVLSGDFDHGGVRRLFVEDKTDDGAPITWELQPRPVVGTSPQQLGYFRRLVMKVTNVTVGQQINSIAIVGPTEATTAISTMTGSVAVPAFATSVTVSGPFGSGYQVKVGVGSVSPPPYWIPKKALTAKTATGFTITFSDPAPAAGGLMDWTVLLNPVRSPRSISQTVTIPVTVGAVAGVGGGFGQQPFGTSPFGGSTAMASVPEIDITFGLGLIGTNARAIISGQGPITIRGLEWHVRSKPLRRPSVYV